MKPLASNAVRLVGFGLVLAGLSALACLAYLHAQERAESEPAFLIAEPLLTLSAAVPETYLPAAFSVKNVSRHVIRVVGVEHSCGDHNCCIRGEMAAPIEIPPGGSVQVPVRIRIGTPGSFSHEVAIYIDDGRWLREAKVGVKGTAVGPSPTSTAPQAARPADEKEDPEPPGQDR